MKIYKDIEQGSDEWKKIRLGMITGSRLKDVFKPDNLSLVDKLIGEKVSEVVEETYTTFAMQRGTDTEPLAREEYEKYTCQLVDQVGFCVSDKYHYLGLSPDGLIKTGKKYKKGIEIKCPNTETHVKYIRQNKMPTEYKYQILNYFLVCQDLEEVDFVSFDNRFGLKPLHIITIKRSEVAEDLKTAEEELAKFWVKFERYYSEITF